MTFTRKELETYTKKELIRLIKFFGITLPSTRVTKVEIVNKIDDFVNLKSPEPIVENEEPHIQRSVRIQRIYNHSNKNK